MDKDLNLGIKMSTHGFEESTHEDSGQRFKFGNKSVKHMTLRSRHMKTVNKDLNLVIKVSTHEIEEST